MFNIISLYLIAMAVVAVYWSAYVRTLNGSIFTRTIFLLCIAMCFYIMGYAMELNAQTPSQIEFWNMVEYIGIPYVSALWLTTALQYTGHFTRRKIALLAAIYIIPIITMVLRFTNEYHHLYFATVSYVEEYGRYIFVKTIGPWMYVQLAHSMLMILVSMSLFVYDSVKSEEKKQGKIRLTIAASVFAVAGLILMQVKPFAFTIDYMALFLPITCVLVILAIARYDLLETKSMARSKAFEFSTNAILLINRRHRILDYNSSAKQLFASANIRVNNGYIPVLFDKFPDFSEALIKEEQNVVKLRERYYEITTMSIDNEKTTRGWIKTIRDITELYQLNEELKKQALTDELSSLGNRRAFIQTAHEWVWESKQSGQPLHLAMLDLDNFKNVNDQYGHPGGDYVIRDFSQMLKRHFGTNSLVARLGGEEFAVLQSGLTDDEMLQNLNEFLINTEKHRFSYRGLLFHVTVSIGLTKMHPGQALESMMHGADKALYQSKDQGRNRITVF